MPADSPLNDAEARREVARVFDAAVTAHKMGRLADAEAGYRSVLELVPNESEPNYLLGMVLLATDRLGDAIAAFNTCLEVKPDHASALNAVGSAYSKLKRHDDALDALSRASKLESTNAKIWFNLGHAYVEAKDYDRAFLAYEKVLTLAPEKWEALNGTGLCLLEMGKVDEATSILLRCIENAPNLEAAHINLIRCFIKEEKFDEALSRCASGIENWPNSPDFHVFAAAAHKNQSNVDESLAQLQAALDKDPDCIMALNHVAGQLNDLGLWKEAEEYAKRSLVLESDDASMLTLMGHIRQMRGDLAGAQAYCNEAIRADATYAEAYNNLGNILNYMDQHSAAEAAFAEAAVLKPNSHGIRLNRAIAQMTTGDIHPACRDYRHRFSAVNSRLAYRSWDFPEWNEEQLTGKRLLLWSDQGIGDEVLFARYVPDLIATCADGVLECEPRLLNLFRRSFPDTDIYAQTTPPAPEVEAKEFDYHGALIDVCCAHFQTSAQVPAALPLVPAPCLTTSLRQKYLELSGGKPLIGISWRSGGSQTSHFKSTPLSEWADVLANTDVAFVNLQYGDVSDEVATASRSLATQIITDKDINPLKDLDPFAAQVAAMDLVITTSNATAHFAGALGKEVWNMIPTGPGRLWYWFNKGTTTPWYDSMTLYRHHHNEGWAGVLNQVGEDLLKATPMLGAGTD